MKKIFGSLLSVPAILLGAQQVFAAPQSTNLNPCPENGQFSALCKFTDLGSVLGFVITIGFIIAILISLFFLIWGGIKWITSGGDKAGVEGARNQIIAAVIGLIIVFLAFFILNLVLGFFNLNLFDLKLPQIADFQK